MRSSPFDELAGDHLLWDGRAGELPNKAAMDAMLKYRRTASHSSPCSSKIAPIRRSAEAALGKMPTTLHRLPISR